MELIAYLRVSTDEQERNGLGLAAQKRALVAYAKGHEHDIVGWHEDTASGRQMREKNGRYWAEERPGLRRALDQLADGTADGLIVAKLDRISRSVIDFGKLLTLAKRQQWSFVSIDLGVDTSTASGELVAGVMMQIAQWERRIIGERTSEALQAKKREGARLGRPMSEASRQAQAKALRWRARGWTWRRIADTLNKQGVPTAQGGTKWRINTVRGLVKSAELDAEAQKARSAS